MKFVKKEEPIASYEDEIDVCDCCGEDYNSDELGMCEYCGLIVCDICYYGSFCCQSEDEEDDDEEDDFDDEEDNEEEFEDVKDD